MDVRKVQSLVETIESTLAELKREIATNPTINVMVNGPARIKVGNEELLYTPPKPPESFDIKGLIDSPHWPEAVYSDIICSVESEEDKIARAEALMDMTIETNLRDLRFLDYGCGDGYMAADALNRGVALSVGYDPNTDSFQPSSNDRLRFTNDANTLEPNGYDVILLYDVLDHCGFPSETMYHVGSLLAPGGTVYVVCHPWTSRHGGHLYRQFNKAFAHLWFNDADLMLRGLKMDQIQRITRPFKTYRQWFNTTGFAIRSEDKITSDMPLENFFTKDFDVWSYLTRMYRQQNITNEEIKELLEIDFIAYVLQVDSIY